MKDVSASLRCLDLIFLDPVTRKWWKTAVKKTNVCGKKVEIRGKKAKSIQDCCLNPIKVPQLFTHMWNITAK